MLKSRGFTIVELLIVIVVIAILAAITIVAYNGIQDQARLATVKSDLSNAAKKMEVYRIQNNDTYPTTLAGAGVTASGDVTLQLSVDNSSSPKTFCITAVHSSSVGTAYRITQAGTVENGQCSGHTTNPGFTNLVNNPGFEASSSSTTARRNLFAYSYAYNQMTRTENISYDGKTWDRYSLNSGVNAGHTRHYANLADLTNGYTYTTQWEVANDGTSPISVSSDWCDISGGSATIAPGETRVITVTQSRGTYDATFRFADLTVSGSSSARSVLVRNVMIEQSRNALAFFNGSTASDQDFSYGWTGAPNASPSVQSGTSPLNYGSNRVANIQSSAWVGAGSRSLRQIPLNSASNDNYTELTGGSNMAIPTSTLQPSTEYTLMATVHIEEPLTGTLSGNGTRSLFVHLNGTTLSLNGTRQAPNEPGTYDLRVTFTTPASFANYNTIRLYHGGHAGSGDLWWDKIGLVEGNYTGPYFE
tara:strand:+ start:4826 stop:6250 length:1425 start_codon:yes stop_codon:yes gene_type:complete